MDDLDHRNLGVRLNLWHLQEDAPGMVCWHPRGYAVCCRVIRDMDLRRDIGSITAPTLIIAGADDPVHMRFGNAFEFAQQIIVQALSGRFVIDREVADGRSGGHEN